MKAVAILCWALGVSAIPSFQNDPAMLLKMREALENEELRRLITRDDALGISRAQGNCGPVSCPTFNAKEQKVSTEGEHKWSVRISFSSKERHTDISILHPGCRLVLEISVGYALALTPLQTMGTYQEMDSLLSKKLSLAWVLCT